ncbi:hypothetical protein COLO4_02718 [Corchorus olitorius]|uniref:DUF4283 domain-containing protein n=1 Tax=Corchorus olitorius TaxID=93759 RepID=A0A1R3L0E7_9ROSI|nr:hypothetical protein COLO4_02718 [Corchorus olitorius]
MTAREEAERCIVGFLLDIKRFSIETILKWVNKEWRPLGEITVIGRDDNKYLIYFSNEVDRKVALEQTSWSYHGALFATRKWNPNVPLKEIVLDRIELWLQIYPTEPLAAGCTIERDNGTVQWVEFKYEKIRGTKANPMGVIQRSKIYGQGILEATENELDRDLINRRSVRAAQGNSKRLLERSSISINQEEDWSCFMEIVKKHNNNWYGGTTLARKTNKEMLVCAASYRTENELMARILLVRAMMSRMQHYGVKRVRCRETVGKWAPILEGRTRV